MNLLRNSMLDIPPLILSFWTTLQCVSQVQTNFRCRHTTIYSLTRESHLSVSNENENSSGKSHRYGVVNKCFFARDINPRFDDYFFKHFSINSIAVTSTGSILTTSMLYTARWRVNAVLFNGKQKLIAMTFHNTSETSWKVTNKSQKSCSLIDVELTVCISLSTKFFDWTELKIDGKKSFYSHNILNCQFSDCIAFLFIKTICNNIFCNSCNQKIAEQFLFDVLCL